MNSESYTRMADALRKRPHQLRFLLWSNKILTGITFLAYPMLLIFLSTSKRWAECYHCILVPAVSFVVVSMMRRILNAPRPYEALEITPLISKDTKGKSFPSRHVFSAFMIAMTFLVTVAPLGVCFLIVGVLLAVVRVIGGVHFMRDVVAGAALGILCGILGYFVIF